MLGDLECADTSKVLWFCGSASPLHWRLKGDMISSSHISHALEANGNFIPASSDTAGDDSLYD
jgi:hypothetical protein